MKGKLGKPQINIQFFANRGIGKQSDRELRKSLRSWEEKLDLHRRKVQNPEKYDTGWNDKTERHKAGLVKHWEKEIRNFEANIEQAKEELKKRGETNE